MLGAGYDRSGDWGRSGWRLVDLRPRSSQLDDSSQQRHSGSVARAAQPMATGCPGPSRQQPLGSGPNSVVSAMHATAIRCPGPSRQQPVGSGPDSIVSAMRVTAICCRGPSRRQHVVPGPVAPGEQAPATVHSESQQRRCTNNPYLILRNNLQDP